MNGQNIITKHNRKYCKTMSSYKENYHETGSIRLHGTYSESYDLTRTKKFKIIF